MFRTCVLGSSPGLRYGEDGPEEGEAGIRRADRPCSGCDGSGDVGWGEMIGGSQQTGDLAEREVGLEWDYCGVTAGMGGP